MAEKYVYSISPAEKTGFTVVSCTDTETGLVVRTPLASNERSYPAFIAYVGAKFSRSREGLLTIMEEVETGYRDGVLTPEKRLGNIVVGLKHQSPGGMAHVAVDMENLPIMTAATLFRTTVLCDGQEGSTRFIEFASGNALPELKNLLPDGVELSPEILEMYHDLQETSLDLYKKWREPVKDFFKEHFKIDAKDRKQMDALEARTFDTIRGFLLSGFRTSMIYVTNATTMQQVLSNFGAGRLPGEKQLSGALMALLAPKEKIEGYSPEIMPLLNHTEPNMVTRKEQEDLKDFFTKQLGFDDLLKKRKRFSGLVDNSCDLISARISQADQIVAQHILVLYPSLNLRDIVDYVRTLSDKQKAKVGEFIFSNRNRFNLPAIAASTGSVDVDLKIDLGIERDGGRHRTFDRISPIHETYVGMDEIPETGFTQAAYLRQIPEMAEIQRGMELDMLRFYVQRSTFLDKLEGAAGKVATNKVGMYLLPLAHQVEMIMSGDPRYSESFLDTRIREGAHIDMRLVTETWSKKLAARNPLYRSLKYPNGRVKVDDRGQFISRE